MTDIEHRITELTEKYQWAIRGEHHKDRDCHWAIVKEWSYGDAPTYHVDHEGYLHEWDGPKSFPDSTAAHAALLQFLHESLEDITTWEDE
ncbi:hypothetical protein QP735_04260 [Curtobacterium citreum]|uniref:hypothetical protein n=1 Tax=Curtobacterium citreum TaxID=2036 RepID=UPI00254BE385|nr:hypothetical protein [Curtobacterium citreum]MDK8171737.1 hypothetical protein [Curtobacterium citreum]